MSESLPPFKTPFTDGSLQALLLLPENMQQHRRGVLSSAEAGHPALTDKCRHQRRNDSLHPRPKVVTVAMEQNTDNSHTHREPFTGS